MIVLTVAATPAALPVAADPPRATAETLVGSWNGRWTVAGAETHGSVGLVLARVPGRPDVIGQFSFVTGATTRSLRYEGRIVDGRLEFPLLGDGRIVLDPVAAPRPGVAERLRGEWTDARGALPRPQGVIELRRTN